MNEYGVQLSIETGTTPPVRVWFVESLAERQLEVKRSFARQYAEAYIEGRVSWARCERVLKGTRRMLRRIVP